MARTYQSQRIYTRLDFTPLTWTCELECLTPQSPVTQTSNSLIGEYEPDRSVTPTVIRPKVTVLDTDGVYPNGINNHSLASDKHVWLLNGVDISTVWKEGTDYSVTKDATDNNGSLTVMRNVDPTESYELSYSGMFNDFRTGTNYVVSASGMVLSTSDKGEDEISVCVDVGHVVYDPLQDGLLLYEYLVSKGLATSGSRSSHVDGTSYERTVTVTAIQGTTPLTSLGTMTMRLVERGSTSALQGGTDDHPELATVAYPTIKFDLRFVENKEYEVQILDADGNIKAREGITISRDMAALTVMKVARQQDIAVGQQRYYNVGIFAVGDNTVNYPELYYHIQWWTQARKYDAATLAYTYADRVDRNIGEKMECDVEDLGLGYTKNDNLCDVAMDIYERSPHVLLTDGGNILTDGDGNVLVAAAIEETT